MNLSNSITEIIKKRYSCRAFTQQKLPLELKEKILNFINTHSAGLLGNSMRFAWVENKKSPGKAKIGTYGFISNAPAFLAGTAPASRSGLIDYGFVLEKIILYLTDLKLGTCWLGGSFKRSQFSEILNPGPAEFIPAITPVGYPLPQKTLRERAIRKVVHADNRKPWAELFFHTAYPNPLKQNQVPDYSLPLEMVRLAPSASNKQPWRIIADPKNNGFHFFIERNKPNQIANNMLTVDLPLIDIGIALCHFELTGDELDLPGKWREMQPSLPTVPSNWEYIISRYFL